MERLSRVFNKKKKNLKSLTTIDDTGFTVVHLWVNSESYRFPRKRFFYCVRISLLVTVTCRVFRTFHLFIFFSFTYLLQKIAVRRQNTKFDHLQMNRIRISMILAGRHPCGPNLVNFFHNHKPLFYCTNIIIRIRVHIYVRSYSIVIKLLLYLSLACLPTRPSHPPRAPNWRARYRAKNSVHCFATCFRQLWVSGIRGMTIK